MKYERKYSLLSESCFINKKSLTTKFYELQEQIKETRWNRKQFYYIRFNRPLISTDERKETVTLSDIISN